MSQRYAGNHSDEIKGLILMGSVLLRDHHSINPDGTTHFDYDVPTLTLAGTKDGLMRITRAAESYWHQIKNIEDAQAGMFPVVAVEGASHLSFMSGKPPHLLAKKDLRAQIPESEAHTLFAEAIAEFTQDVLNASFGNVDETSTAEIVAPMIDAMELEGYYNLKEPCYNILLVNPEDPTCLHGSPWNAQYSQKIMGGDLLNGDEVVNDDNFHRVYSIKPVHLPEVDTQCSKKDSGCKLKSITVSQNHYGFKDKLDTGYYPISASEIKTKLSSRQRVQ